jgi:hypothetical protein
MIPTRARPPRRRRGATLRWLLPGIAAAVAIVSFAVAVTQAVGSAAPARAPDDPRAAALPTAQQLAAPQPAAPLPSDLSVDRLKAAYLECDRSARTRLIDGATAGLCSTIGEELMRRGFGGDFDALLAWWRSETKPAG